MEKSNFGSSLYFVADIGANHDGNLDRALRLIELAKESGAHAAKFQNFQAAKIVNRIGFENLANGIATHQSNWKKPVFESYQDASISQDWTAHLYEKCRCCEIDYFTSPYDYESVDHVDSFVELYKIGSGDITWTDFIRYISSKGKPVLLATGAATDKEVELAVSTVLGVNPNLVLMQCNTNYTIDQDKHKFVNLNVLRTYCEKYPQVILGLSDHTKGHATVCGAVALGARVIEKHFTDDNTREGPDHQFAMNPAMWRKMVTTATEVYESLGDGVKRVEENEVDSRIVQQRSMHAIKYVPAGKSIQRADFEALRPCPEDAVRPYEFLDIIGRSVKRSLQTGDYLSRSDFE